jgi:hypothetical protein
LSRSYFILTLYVVIFILLVANLYVIYTDTILRQQYWFTDLFYFDRRLNLPFFFSLFLLLTNLFFLYKIVKRKHPSRSESIFWNTFLITLFLFTLDEAFYIHQHFKMSTFGRIASYDRASWSHYLWVIPYFLVFGALIWILAKHSSSIPKLLTNKLLIAGLVFLTGAVCMEFVGTYYAVLNPKGDIFILLIKTVEAVLQLVGAVMFVNVFQRKNEDPQETAGSHHHF